MSAGGRDGLGGRGGDGRSPEGGSSRGGSGDVPSGSFEETRVKVHGLTHHVIVWNDDAPGPDRGGFETIVLCHGFLDFAWSWRMTAEALVRRGHRVVAFDWRGHGETDWVATSGYYHFADYVRDLDALLPRLGRAPDERVHLVGHSMGGTATSLYAATRGDETLRSLSLIEGLGPPPIDPRDAPNRFGRFLRATRKVIEGGRAHPAPPATLDEAAERMRVRNPGMPTGSLGRFLAERATRPTEDGRRTWRFDPLHRTPNPNPVPVDAYGACLEALGGMALPVLLVRGSAGLSWPDEAARRARLGPGATTVTIEGVGHMVHWEAPDELATHLHTFVHRTKTP